MDISRHNSYLDFSRSNHPGAVGSDQYRIAFPHAVPCQNHIFDGDALGNADHRLNACGDGFINRRCCEGRRHINDRNVSCCFSARLGNTIENRNSLKILTPFSRSHASNKTVLSFCVIKAVPGMELSGLSRDPLSNYTALLIDQYRHRSVSSSCDDFFSCISHSRRGNHIEA